jgi:lipopolysaccharide exporter
MREKDHTGGNEIISGGMHAHEKSSFISDSLKLVSGAGLAQVIRAALSPLLARLFLPGALGTAQNFSAIAKTLSALSTLRYEESIPLPKKRMEAFHQLLISFLFTGISSGCALILVLFLRLALAALLNAPEMANLLLGVPLFILARGSFLALQQWTAREEKYGRVSVAFLTESILWNGGSASLGLAGLTNSSAIAISQITGQSAAASILAYSLLRKDRRAQLPMATWADLKKGIVMYLKVPLYNFWSKLLDNSALYLPAVLFSAFFSPAAAGQYTLGFNLLQLPFSVLGGSLGQVLYQRASAAHGKRDIALTIETVLAGCLTLGTFPALVCGIIAPELVALLFGSNWQEAGLYAQILSPWMLFIFLSLVLERIPAVAGKNENIFIFHAFNTVVRGAALIMGSMQGSPLLAVTLLSIGGSIIYLTNILSSANTAGVTPARISGLFASKLVYTLPFLGAAFAAKQWLFPETLNRPFFIVLAAVLIGCVYYTATFLSDRSAREILAHVIKKELS